MNKDKYFELMRETTKITDKIILDIIEEKNFMQDLKEKVLELPLKRINSNKPKSRPAFLRLHYELFGGKDWTKFQNTAAALEMLNLSTYTLNYVLDEKGGEKPKQERNNELMAAMIQRELAQELFMRDKDKLSYEQFQKIDECFSEINYYTSGIGQFYDGNALRELKDNSLEIYEKKCEGLTGMFMKNISKIGAILANASPEQIQKAGEFGRNYGIIIQIVNDLKDFLPLKLGNQSVGKVYQDQFADLKHGSISFAPLYILENGREQDQAQVRKVWNNYNAPAEECEKVTAAIVRGEVYKKVKKFCYKFAKPAKKILKSFEKNDARDYLSVALTVWRSNKVYGSFARL